MSSPTELANMALGYLGMEPNVTDLDTDTTPPGIVCRLFFENARDACLRAYPWNCASGRKTLTRLADDPDSGWSYAYQLPSDCLLVLAMNDVQSTGDQGDDFRIEGRTLVTDETTVKIRYVRRMTDYSQYDPLLYDLVALRLASMISVSLAPAIAGTINNLYKDRLTEARRRDAGEGQQKRTYADVDMSAWPGEAGAI